MKRYQQGKQGLTIVCVKAFPMSIGERWVAERPSVLCFKVSISLERRQRRDLWEASVNTGTTPRYQMPFFSPCAQSDPPSIEWAVVAQEEAKRVCHKQD